MEALLSAFSPARLRRCEYLPVARLLAAYCA